MTISDNLDRFANLPVRDFEPDKNGPSAAKVAYRIRIEYDEAEPNAEELKAIAKMKGFPKKPTPWVGKFAKFLSQESSADAVALVIGMWFADVDDGVDPVVASLVAANSRLPKLRSLFIGDITAEECEISWIVQGNIAPVLAAYPKLEEFRVRGGTGLSLGTLEHDHLQSLAIESGGLPVSVVREVCNARLPELRRLEIWLGSDNYGWDGAVDDLQPILSGKLFPKLEYLGLRDCEIADEVAAAVAASPIVEQLRVLDISLGNLGDAGARALLSLPTEARLELLDLHHHYVSAEVIHELRTTLPFEINAEDERDGGEDDEDRFIAVAE